jgi:cell division protein ZapE
VITLSETYAERLASGRLQADPAQSIAVAELERLRQDLLNHTPLRGWRRLRLRLGGRLSPVRGIYLWGGVGRGKTLLLDLFFDCLPFKDKKRLHFHRFMAAVHDELKALGGQENPLDLVADRIAAEARIVCFDEFSVTDIADAMILGNLLAALFKRGVSFATTSNIEPKALYRDGLQRQQFLAAIELLELHTAVLHIESRNDYRLRVLERADVYQYPAGKAADRHLADYFAAIAPSEVEPDGKILILGRELAHRQLADGVIWFDFETLCDGPRSQDDYIELSRIYQTVLLSDVPQFDETRENQARRFIALIDEFYDRRVKLILSAAAPLASLYRGRRQIQTFARTASRLQEMQSHDYLASAHNP